MRRAEASDDRGSLRVMAAVDGQPPCIRSDLLALHARVDATRDAAVTALAEIDALLERVASQPERSSVASDSGRRPAPREQWLTIKQAAEEFGLTPKYFYARWREIPGVKNPSRKVIRIPRSGLEKFMGRGLKPTRTGGLTGPAEG